MRNELAKFFVELKKKWLDCWFSNFWMRLQSAAMIENPVEHMAFNGGMLIAEKRTQGHKMRKHDANNQQEHKDNAENF